MPPRRRMSDRGRIILIVIAAVIVVGLFSVRFLASFYVDYLWHQSVGRTDVFWGVLGAKATLFGMFAGTFVVLGVLNLIIADRLAPTSFSANVHPVVERFHEFFGHRLRCRNRVDRRVVHAGHCQIDRAGFRHARGARYRVGEAVRSVEVCVRSVGVAVF